MTFIVLFFTLLLQYFKLLPSRSISSRSFARWHQLAEKDPRFDKLGRYWRYILVVVIPTAFIGVVFHFIEMQLWGLPAIVLEVALLLYVLSHADFQQYVEQYRRDLSAGDVQGAYHCAEQHLSVPEIELTDDLAQMHDQVCETVMYRWFEFFFLMVFWFALAGVPGVILAWFTLQYVQRVNCAEQAWRPLTILEWVPSRILGLTFALAGNFVRAIPAWQSSLWNWQVPAADALYKVALAALYQGDGKSFLSNNSQSSEQCDNDKSEGACDQLLELQLLHRRSATIWLAMIAAMAIFGGLFRM